MPVGGAFVNTQIYILFFEVQNRTDIRLFRFSKDKSARNFL